MFLQKTTVSTQNAESQYPTQEHQESAKEKKEKKGKRTLEAILGAVSEPRFIEKCNIWCHYNSLYFLWATLSLHTKVATLAINRRANDTPQSREGNLCLSPLLLSTFLLKTTFIWLLDSNIQKYQGN